MISSKLTISVRTSVRGVVVLTLAVVVINLFSSLDGDERCEEAVEGGWSDTSIPLSCWSKLLDLEDTLKAWMSCDMQFVVLVAVFVVVIMGALLAVVCELWLNGLFQAFGTALVWTFISILSLHVFSVDSLDFELIDKDLISSANLAVEAKASFESVFKRLFSFCLAKRGGSFLWLVRTRAPPFGLSFELEKINFL